MIANAAPGRRHRWLLGVVVLVWGVSRPVIKLGLGAVPPIWFSCLRYAMATVCLLAPATARDELALLPLHETVRISLATGIVLIAGGIRLATLDTLVARSGTRSG